MKDYLTPHLRDLPCFRALLRAVEARFYKDISLPRPVLDLGYGVGHFASLAFLEPLFWCAILGFKTNLWSLDPCSCSMKFIPD